MKTLRLRNWLPAAVLMLEVSATVVVLLLSAGAPLPADARWDNTLT